MKFFILALLVSTTVLAGPFIRGDANDDGTLDISDAVTVLRHLFGGKPVACEDAIDANDSGGTDIADAVYVLAHLFASGPPPSAPYPDCGPDTTTDELACGVRQRCPLPSVSVEEMCSDDPGVELKWKITNHEALALNVFWCIEGTSVCGDLSLDAEETADITTTTQPENNTFLVLYEGSEVDRKVTTFPECSHDIWLRNATGHTTNVLTDVPRLEVTNGMNGSAATLDWCWPEPDCHWGITGVRVTVSEPFQVTGIAGVGGYPVGEGLSCCLRFCGFHLNVHSAHGEYLTPEEAFTASTQHGNVVDDLALGNLDTIVEHGVDEAGDGTNYYFTFDLTRRGNTFVLQPGRYIVSAYTWGSGCNSIGWTLSRTNLGSDIVTNDLLVPAWLELEGYRAPGTSGLDILGHPAQ